MNKPSANLDLINSFPDTVSKNYKHADAREVRTFVKNILGSFEKKIPSEKLAQALSHINKEYPHGEYLRDDELDNQSPYAVNLGLCAVLFDQLEKDIFGDLDPSSISIIKNELIYDSDALQLDSPETVIQNAFEISKILNPLSPELRILAMKHTKERSAEGSEAFIPHLQEAANALKKGGSDGLLEYEQALGWK